MFSAEKAHGAAVGKNPVARHCWSQWSWSVLLQSRKVELGEWHSWVMQPAGTSAPRVSVLVSAVARAELQHL